MQPAQWQGADDAALWMVTEAAELGLEVPPGAQALELEVLTLPGTGQRLRVALGEARVESLDEGVERLRLPVAAGPARLRVESNRMVGMAEAGLEGDGALGGALLRLHYLADDGPEP